LNKNKSVKDFSVKIANDINVWEKENKTAKQYWKVYLINSSEIFNFLQSLSSLDKLARKEKLLLTSVITYFVNPLDFLPELFLGALGYLDDVVAGALVLNQILHKLPTDFVDNNWKGKIKLIPLIANILNNAEHIVDKLIYNKLKKFFIRHQNH